MRRDTLQRLWEAGVSVWLDPDATVAGTDEDLVSWVAANAVTGVGPSLPPAHPELTDCDALSAFADANPLRALALAHSTRLAQRLANQLDDVHTASRGCDGLVQFPCPPDIWDDAGALTAIAAELTAVTSAPNIMVGLPCNSAGLAAAPEVVLRGVSVAIGPVFSPADTRRALAAYRRGLERRLTAGRSVADVTSIAWVPVGTIDDYAAQLLDARRAELRRSVGATIAELIYLESFRALADPQWQRLRKAGATRQRPAFCHLEIAQDEFDFTRLVLPGSILALTPEAIATIGSMRNLEPAEPDETEATWALQEARRGGLDLVAMSRALRARFEVRSWLAWGLRVGGAARGELQRPYQASLSAGRWP